ncbi:MAG: ferrous iron transporter B, partial [Phycisphaerales bacterium]|nr:ferrous iron transporter B [Phycisphaerales bacterium]
DLPGTWSLGLEHPEAGVVRDQLQGQGRSGLKPDVVLLVLDAANLLRGLHLAAEVLASGIPCVVVVNMIDLARRRGFDVDPARLSTWLGCEVVVTSARHRNGIQEVKSALQHARLPDTSLPDLSDSVATSDWANGVIRESVPRLESVTQDRLSDRLDRVSTHPILGVATFLVIMLGLFWTIFAVAAIPMDLIDAIFGHVGSWIAGILPSGALQELVVDGVVGGLAGTVVFLPQILLLFFLIAILEDTGYLARAAFVMDRVLRRFGLPGQAFVPMLSAHACAIPAIMSARLVPDRRDRLAVMLVAPFLSCSARLPVYVLLIGVLFAEQPTLAGLVFAGCYALGIVAALGSAFLVRKTLIAGNARPMVIELPAWQFPSLRGALLTCWDRGWLFLRKAGTIILAMVIVLWWLSAYPKPPAPESTEAQQRITSTETNPMEWSFAGRIGRSVQPVFEPLGWDWQLSVGVMTSFAAREVFVSTMAVLVANDDDVENPEVLDRIANAKSDDGQPMLTQSSAASLLVFFVLAMQCLPTLAVTAREAGGWKWALLQFSWMSGIAWAGAWITRQLVLLGGGS